MCALLLWAYTVTSMLDDLFNFLVGGGGVGRTEES